MSEWYLTNRKKMAGDKKPGSIRIACSFFKISIDRLLQFSLT